jgi:hypothetical protein
MAIIPVTFPSLVLDTLFDYGDVAALRQFMLDHAVKHNDYAPVIQSVYGQNMPLFDLFDEQMYEDLSKMMKTPAAQRVVPQSVNAWIQLHNSLHTAELQATKIAQGYSLRDDDFSDESQFDDWMQYHAYLHDIQDSVIGAAI